MVTFRWPGILSAILQKCTITASTFAGSVAATTISASGASTLAAVGCTTVTASGAVRAIGAIGYNTGAGGTVTQGTDKTTAVTLNKLCGTITMHAQELVAGAETGFTLTNSTIAADDVVVACIKGVGSVNSYQLTVDGVAAGSCHISLANLSAGNLSEALTINFAVIKAVAA